MPIKFLDLPGQLPGASARRTYIPKVDGPKRPLSILVPRIRWLRRVASCGVGLVWSLTFRGLVACAFLIEVAGTTPARCHMEIENDRQKQTLCPFLEPAARWQVPAFARAAAILPQGDGAEIRREKSRVQIAGPLHGFTHYV
jgi:hypothetical protein